MFLLLLLYICYFESCFWFYQLLQQKMKGMMLPIGRLKNIIIGSHQRSPLIAGDVAASHWVDDDDYDDDDKKTFHELIVGSHLRAFLMSKAGWPCINFNTSIVMNVIWEKVCANFSFDHLCRLFSCYNVHYIKYQCLLIIL